MERLTECDEYGNADIIALSDMMPELYAELSFSETNALTAALNKLTAYEDAEEQGRILPSKPVVLSTDYSDEVDGRHFLLHVTCEITKDQFEEYADELRKEQA